MLVRYYVGGVGSGVYLGFIWEGAHVGSDVGLDVDLVDKPKPSVGAKNHPGWSRWTFASPHLPPLSTTLYHFDPLPPTLYHWEGKPLRKALSNQDSPLFPWADRVSPRVPSRAARFPAPNTTWITWLHMFPGAPTSYYSTLCVYTGKSRFFCGFTIDNLCFLYPSP